MTLAHARFYQDRFWLPTSTAHALARGVPAQPVVWRVPCLRRPVSATKLVPYSGELYLHNTVRHLEKRGIHERTLRRLQVLVAEQMKAATSPLVSNTTSPVP
jgi:hypothetical protein